MKLLARIISFITNPIFILFPVPYLLMYRLGYGHSFSLKWTLHSLIFFIIAGLFVFYEYKHKVFSDMDVSKREQRPLLFSFMIGMALVYLLSLYLFSAPFILFFIVWGGILGILATTLINLKIKASIHIEALTAILIVLVKALNISYLIFLLIPLVAWARIIEKKHTIIETIAGFMLGIILTLIMYILLLYTVPL